MIANNQLVAWFLVLAYGFAVKATPPMDFNNPAYLGMCLLSGTLLYIIAFKFVRPEEK